MAAPTVTIRSVISGTNTSANTGRLDFSWRVSASPPDAATEVWLGGGAPGAQVLSEGEFTDWGSGSSNVFPQTEDSFVVDGVAGTHSIEIVASNADGATRDQEILYSKIPVGYHDATLPGAPVRESELALVRGYLEEIDRRLNDDVLTTLPDFIETFNSRVPEESRFPVFDDLDYLSGGVGTGNLTDDLLRAMRDVLIYIHPYTMPRGYRPGTITNPGRRALCEANIVDGEERGRVFGKTTREWVSICVEEGADALTLLHELYHFGSESNNGDEARAFAVSMCAYA